MKKEKVIVICGPTASGKTALSIELAKKINGEIVSCDSMQIYKDMNIGTAKPSIEEMQGIKHYAIDCLDVHDNYSVFDFQKLSKVLQKYRKKFYNLTTRKNIIKIKNTSPNNQKKR